MGPSVGRHPFGLLLMGKGKFGSAFYFAVSCIVANASATPQSTLHGLVQKYDYPRDATSASILPFAGGRAEVTCADNWVTLPAVRTYAKEAKKSFLTPSLRGALILHKELETKFTAIAFASQMDKYSGVGEVGNI